MPMEVASVGGARFMLVLKDDYTKFRRVFFLKWKSGSVCCLETFINESLTIDHRIQRLLKDNGTEFICQEVRQVLQKYGITHHTSMPYMPQQNGAAW